MGRINMVLCMGQWMFRDGEVDGSVCSTNPLQSHTAELELNNRTTTTEMNNTEQQNNGARSTTQEENEKSRIKIDIIKTKQNKNESRTDLAVKFNKYIC